jgi:hypothetical protein
MACSFGLSATSQQYFFSEQTNHQLAVLFSQTKPTISLQYFSLSTSNQPPAK